MQESTSAPQTGHGSIPAPLPLLESALPGVVNVFESARGLAQGFGLEEIGVLNQLSLVSAEGFAE